LTNPASHKCKGKFALIDGLHDGNISAPSSFVSEFATIWKIRRFVARRNYWPEIGDELCLWHTLFSLQAKFRKGKRKKLEGWAKPEQGLRNGKPVQINSNTRQVRDYPEGVAPNIENKPADAEQQRKLREAQNSRSVV